METIRKKIIEAKNNFGNDLIILGHFYQRPEILEFADAIGDTFSLCKKASESDAKLIVFCGVMFMAEAAAVLSKPNQRIAIPKHEAGCPLAEMADIDQMNTAWKAFEEAGIAEGMIPVTYGNSTVEAKAFTGERGGTCCTSSSAKPAIEWALKNGKRVFFSPDRNLGLNTAAELGITETAVWDPWDDQAKMIEKARKAKLIAWDGYCHVHTKFKVEQIEAARRDYPGCLVVVHPESDPEVVGAADANGSTKFLADYAKNAAPGSTVIIGTEINFVRMMADKHPDKTILPLARSLCPNMFKTNLASLLDTLEDPEKHLVKVNPDLFKPARKSLEQMLKL